jgi:hypothetical protein
VVVGVALTVGVGDGVLVGVAVGSCTVTVPSVVVTEMDVSAVSARDTSESAMGEVPSATVPNCTVAKTPEPFGPGWMPLESQSNEALVAVVVGAGQVTVRPVDPRNAPLTTLTYVSLVSFQVTVNE